MSVCACVRASAYAGMHAQCYSCVCSTLYRIWLPSWSDALTDLKLDCVCTCVCILLDVCVCAILPWQRTCLHKVYILCVRDNL